MSKINWDDINSVGWRVALVALFIIYGRRIMNALWKIIAGEDGKVNMIELSGFMLLLLLMWMVYKEGTRLHDWHLYNEWWIGLIGMLVLLCLGFKDIVKMILNRKEKA